MGIHASEHLKVLVDKAMLIESAFDSLTISMHLKSHFSKEAGVAVCPRWKRPIWAKLVWSFAEENYGAKFTSYHWRTKWKQAPKYQAITDCHPKKTSKACLLVQLLYAANVRKWFTRELAWNDIIKVMATIINQKKKKHGRRDCPKQN